MQVCLTRNYYLHMNGGVMKSITLTLLVLFVCINAPGQTINSGSTGLDGPFNPPSQVPENTIVTGLNAQGNCTQNSPCVVTVPLREPEPGQPIHANGRHVFNFTTVTIGPNVTVKFVRNKANTPVFILAQGDVILSGVIDLSGENGANFGNGEGGPGGFSGGHGLLPGSPTNIAGAGNGPGGGAPGQAEGFATVARFGDGSRAYGIPELLPLIGGSGGAGLGVATPSAPSGSRGGGGGGAILLASSGTLNVGTGNVPTAIIANGGNGRFYPAPPPFLSVTWVYPGSGGAIRLVATNITGNRPLSAAGGGGTGAAGGSGRIRLDSARPLQYNGSTVPNYTKNDNPIFGQPIFIFPPLTPTLRILSIGGVPLPSQPNAQVNTPDIALPMNFTNPVAIVVEGTNVPSGTPFEIFANPQFGSGPRVIVTTGVLLGNPGQVKTATVSVNLPLTGVGIISAVIRTPIVPEPSASIIN